MEDKQKAMLQQIFAMPVAKETVAEISDAIREILRINRAIATLAESARERAGHNLQTIKGRRRVTVAYNENT
jgi:hypothetical protein